MHFQKKWLNEYNAKIREYVGFELKRQLNMQAFYWMMNQTNYVTEYYTDADYRRHISGSKSISGSLGSSLIFAIFVVSIGRHLPIA